MQRPTLALWTLTLGLASVFAFFGVDKFLHPIVWIGWIPEWMEGLLWIDSGLWLQIIGTFEIFCAVLILVPIHTLRKAGAMLMTLQLIAILPIVGFNDVGVRDFGLLLSTMALWMML